MSLQSDVDLLTRVVTLSAKVQRGERILDLDRDLMRATEDVAASRATPAVYRAIDEETALLLRVANRLAWARQDRNEELTALYEKLTGALHERVANNMIAAMKSAAEIVR